MYRFLPILMMLAISPKSEKKLENLCSFLAAAKDSVQTIANSLETFHTNAVPLMIGISANQSAAKGPQTSGENGKS